MKNFFLYLWQLPQNLLGLIVILFSQAMASKDFKDLYVTDYKFGVSLGKYIILHKRYSFDDVCHESGHCRQSKRWGWLYLIVIGLPSALRNLYDRYFHKAWSSEDRQKWYYGHFPEKQADILGGVKR